MQNVYLLLILIAFIGVVVIAWVIHKFLAKYLEKYIGDIGIGLIDVFVVIFLLLVMFYFTRWMGIALFKEDILP